MSKNTPKGRKTIFKKEYIDKIDEYLELCKTEKEVPMVVGFAIYIDTLRDTLNMWLKQAKEYEELEPADWDKLHKDKQQEYSSKITFLHTIKKIKDHNLHQLQQGGLNGTKNARMAQFLLSANHGMSEKTEVKQENTGSTDNNINIKFIE
jgi:hypothetical protein